MEPKAEKIQKMSTVPLSFIGLSLVPGGARRRLGATGRSVLVRLEGLEGLELRGLGFGGVRHWGYRAWDVLGEKAQRSPSLLVET